MKTKKLSEIIGSSKEFEKLLGMCLLFDKSSPYFGWSGIVTAALLDYEEDDGKPITILAIDTKHLNGWLTIKRSKEELIDLLNNCIEFVGNSDEECFTLEKE